MNAVTKTVAVFDVDKVRADFPILQRQVHGNPLVYLDNAATSHKPVQVIETLDRYYREYNSNIHRGVHTLSEEATAAYESARGKIRKFINATSDKEIILTRGTTESINLVAQSWGRSTLKAEDEIIVSQMEHHSNIVPWQLLCEQTGAVLKVVPFNDAGELLFDEYEKLLGPRTRLVAMVHISNALGTINPVKQVIDLAHKYNAMVLIDGAQSIPHAAIDVQALDTDFLLCSPYKFYGPHAGLLYGKLPLLERFGRYKVRPAHDLWETGTPAFEAMAGVTAAINHIAWIGAEFGDPADQAPLSGRRGQLRAGLKAITRYETELVRLLLDGVDQISGVQVRGITDRARLNERTSIVSFTMDFATPDEAAEHLGNDGIQVWSGDFYAPNAIDALGLTEKGGVLRTGLMSYNTADEVQRLLASLKALAASKS